MMGGDEVGDDKEAIEERSSGSAMLGRDLDFLRFSEFRMSSASSSSMKLSFSSYWPMELLRMVPLEGPVQLEDCTLALGSLGVSESSSFPSSILGAFRDLRGFRLGFFTRGFFATICWSVSEPEDR